MSLARNINAVRFTGDGTRVRIMLNYINVKMYLHASFM